MIWLTWRQFRAQALTAAVVLAAAALYFLISGRQMHHTYTTDLASCTPLNNCGDVLSLFQQRYGPMFQLNQLLVIAVPALIGIFWGAPLIGRELETGTDQFVWNQSITRTRWLAVKLTIVVVASIVTAGLFSYLMTWWAGPLDHINGGTFAPTGDRFAALTFASRHIVPLGYAAFAFALGATVGLLLRRTLPAMALTLAVFIAVQVLVPTLIRPHLLPSTTASFPINTATTSQSSEIYGDGDNFHFGLPIPPGAWVLSAPPVQDSSGHAADTTNYPDCFPGPNSQMSISQSGACLTRYDLHEGVTYQPPTNYWPLQWLETALYLAVAAALTGTCFWQIRRRHN